MHTENIELSFFCAFPPVPSILMLSVETVEYCMGDKKAAQVSFQTFLPNFHNNLTIMVYRVVTIHTTRPKVGRHQRLF